MAFKKVKSFRGAAAVKRMLAKVLSPVKVLLVYVLGMVVEAWTND